MVKQTLPPVRRIVTAQRPGGRSFVTSAAPPPFKKTTPDGTEVIEIWATRTTPEALRYDDHEPTSADLSMTPPAQGSIIRIANVTPSPAQISAADAKEWAAKLGGADTLVESGDPRGHMHRTESIDYVLVIAGSITLVLDDDEVILHPGDVVVQRGSNHFWYNHTQEMAHVAFIMIGATLPET